MNFRLPIFLLLLVNSLLAIDTDGDGLDDSVETNTGVYVSETDTGTDPNNADSDGDMFGDGYEIKRSTDPCTAGSKPESSLQLTSIIDPASFGDITPAKEIKIENNNVAVWDSTGNGKIHLFDFSNGDLTLKSSINAPHRSHDFPAFGYSISMNGNLLVTGDSITWLDGIHDGRGYQYDISNQLSPIQQHVLKRDTQTATYFGNRVLAVNGFSIFSSEGSSRYGTLNKVHIFQSNGNFYKTIADGYDKNIEFARSESRNSFLVARSDSGLTSVKIYDVDSGEVVDRSSNQLQFTFSSEAWDINHAQNQYAWHRIAFDGDNVFVVDDELLRVFTYQKNNWSEVSFDLKQYTGGVDFSSTNILMTNDLILVSSPNADCSDGGQGCVVIFDRIKETPIPRFRETLTSITDSIPGKFGSYIAYHENSNRLLINTEFGSTHAWDVVNTNNGKWAVYQMSVSPPDPSTPVISLDTFYESNSGESITFDATPIDGYPTDYTYQWYFNSSPVSPSFGGTSSSLTLTGNSFDDGTWKVEVTNDTGTTSTEFEYRVFSDADNDGLSDYREANILGTDPNNNDSDGDALLDGVETNTGIWVSASDTGTDPLSNDTDADGLLDGVETNTGEYVDASDTGTDPLNPDTDGDGLIDGSETNTGIYVNSSDTGTDPLNNDSDFDGILDGYETATGSWLSSEDTGTNPTKADSDADGLSDRVETNSGVFVGLSDTGTDPNSQDSDGDGFADKFEVDTSYDPTSITDTPDAYPFIETALEVNFYGAIGGTYRIEHTEDLESDSWVTVEDGIEGSSELIERLYSTDDYSRRFFRVIRTDQ